MYTHNNVQLNQKAMNPLIASILHRYIMKTLYSYNVNTTMIIG